MSAEMSQKEQLAVQEELEKEMNAHEAANQVASQKAMEQVMNPEFLEKLGDANLDIGELHDWVSDELGPAASRAHAVANRERDFENQQKWLNMNASERVIAERRRGRLCKGPLQVAAARALGCSKIAPSEIPDQFNPDEKRVMRDAYRALTSFQSLGVEGEGLSAVSEITTETKTGKTESESKSTVERIKSIYS